MGLYRWLFRPNHADWKPVANVSDCDYLTAYKRAAKKLGIRIKVGYPVPCVAGADLAAYIGHKGIYIDRAQAAFEGALSDEMFKQRAKLSY